MQQSGRVCVLLPPFLPPPPSHLSDEHTSSSSWWVLTSTTPPSATTLNAWTGCCGASSSGRPNSSAVFASATCGEGVRGRQGGGRGAKGGCNAIRRMGPLLCCTAITLSRRPLLPAAACCAATLTLPYNTHSTGTTP